MYEYIPGIIAPLRMSYKKYNEIHICNGQDQGKWINLRAFCKFGQSTDIKFMTSDSAMQDKKKLVEYRLNTVILQKYYSLPFGCNIFSDFL